jgi:hypothetical protein
MRNPDRRYTHPCTALDISWRFEEFEASKFQDRQHVNVSKFSAVYIGHIYPQLYIPCTQFFQSLIRHKIHSVTGNIVSIKLFNDRVSGIELVTSLLVAVIAIAWKLILFKFLDVVELCFFLIF